MLEALVSRRFPAKNVPPPHSHLRDERVAVRLTHRIVAHAMNRSRTAISSGGCPRDELAARVPCSSCGCPFDELGSERSGACGCPRVRFLFATSLTARLPA